MLIMLVESSYYYKPEVNNNGTHVSIMVSPKTGFVEFREYGNVNSPVTVFTRKEWDDIVNFVEGEYAAIDD